MESVVIYSAEGTPPFQISLCDMTNTFCYIVGIDVTTFPVTLTVPPPLQNVNQMLVSIKDAYYCNTFQTLSFLTPTPPPTQSPAPAVTSKSGPVELTLVASRGNSYIDIIVDGVKIEKGSMFQGETKTFKGKKVISIYLSNPAGLDLTHNGKQLAPLGGQNEEVRRTFR